MNPKPVYGCAECGCVLAQVTSWISCATDDDGGGDGPLSDGYCPRCDDEVDVDNIFERFEYDDETKQAIISAVEYAHRVAALKRVREYAPEEWEKISPSMATELRDDVLDGEWHPDIPGSEFDTGTECDEEA